jgi:hypothetical protein
MLDCFERAPHKLRKQRSAIQRVILYTARAQPTHHAPRTTHLADGGYELVAPLCSASDEVLDALRHQIDEINEGLTND